MGGEINHLIVCSVVNSFGFDFLLRIKSGGTSLAYFVLEELPLPLPSKVHQRVALMTAQLNCASNLFAPIWLQLRSCFDSRLCWKQLWAITPYERLRLRAILDAVVAHLYGLNTDDFAWILRDCDHPIERVNDNAIARSFDPKGFWRVDKDKPP